MRNRDSIADWSFNCDCCMEFCGIKQHVYLYFTSTCCANSTSRIINLLYAYFNFQQIGCEIDCIGIRHFSLSLSLPLPSSLYLFISKKLLCCCIQLQLAFSYFFEIPFCISRFCCCCCFWFAWETLFSEVYK